MDGFFRAHDGHGSCHMRMVDLMALPTVEIQEPTETVPRWPPPYFLVPPDRARLHHFCAARAPGGNPIGSTDPTDIRGIFRQQNILVKWHGCISWMDMCQYLVLNKPDGRIKRDHIKLQPTLGSMGFNAMWSTQCENPPRLTGNGSYKPSKVWGRFCCCVYHRRF